MYEYKCTEAETPIRVERAKDGEHVDFGMNAKVYGSAFAYIINVVHLQENQ